MTRARSLMAGAVVVLSTLLVGGFLVGACGPELTACSGSDCGDVAGAYAVGSSQVQGTCDFTPYTLPSTIVVQQSTDKTQVSVGILDQVNQQTVELTGPLYVKDSSTKYSVGTISLTQQTVRLATPNGTDSVNLQVTFSASVTGDAASAKNYILSGSLTTTSIPSGGGTGSDGGAASCAVSVSFSASRPAG